jgi:hypothetical protein
MDQRPPERTETRPASGLPPHLGSIQVLARFGLRVPILAAFALLGDHGFGRTFASLLAMAVIYCAFAGALRREAPLGPVLTHWDEAAGYAIVARLASSLG